MVQQCVVEWSPLVTYPNHESVPLLTTGLTRTHSHRGRSSGSFPVSGRSSLPGLAVSTIASYSMPVFRLMVLRDARAARVLPGGKPWSFRHSCLCNVWLLTRGTTCIKLGGACTRNRARVCPVSNKRGLHAPRPKAGPLPIFGTPAHRFVLNGSARVVLPRGPLSGLGQGALQDSSSKG
jgi:hypothetical protein